MNTLRYCLLYFGEFLLYILGGISKSAISLEANLLRLLIRFEDKYKLYH